MSRTAFAATLMIVAMAGPAMGQDVSREERVAEILEARGDIVETRTAEVQALTQALADRAGGRQQPAFGVATGIQRAASALTYTALGYPVSYSISGRLADDPSSSSPLPIEIVSAIRADTHLKSMSVGSGPASTLRVVDGAASVSVDNRPSFNAAFGFADLDEFHAWYSAQGGALHQAIDRAGAEDVRFNLSVQPDNTAGAVLMQP